METKTNLKGADSGKMESILQARADIMSVSELKKWYSEMNNFGKEILKANIDYGSIPGMKKPTLFKSGAEKIKKAFNLQIELLDCVKEINDYDKGYLDFTYKCIISTKDGTRLGICEGNANSRENRFRYEYKSAAKIPDRKEINILKAQGKGKWDVIDNKWVWLERVENPDIYSLKNSIQKVAQKRAFVGAIIMATGTSSLFVQAA
jgi:hypothetical protein